MGAGQEDSGTASAPGCHEAGSGRRQDRPVVFLMRVKSAIDIERILGEGETDFFAANSRVTHPCKGDPGCAVGEAKCIVAVRSNPAATGSETLPECFGADPGRIEGGRF